MRNDITVAMLRIWSVRLIVYFLDYLLYNNIIQSRLKNILHSKGFVSYASFYLFLLKIYFIFYNYILLI